MQFVHAMMSLHVIYYENNVAYTKQNQRLSIDFEYQSHNFTSKSLLVEPNFSGGGGGDELQGGEIPVRPYRYVVRSWFRIFYKVAKLRVGL